MPFQLAKVEGLRVIADASEADEQLVRELGADHVIRRGKDFGSQVREIGPRRRSRPFGSGVLMPGNESAESVVCDFMAAWRRWQVDELAGFLGDDAVWVDGYNVEIIGAFDVDQQRANCPMARLLRLPNARGQHP
ncbi:MDR/zinc-dependent alcohol dehydrogenase-like family protein [Mycobacterium branderi]|uniref:Uncharacterized protein n=1 Tax=Mycobacterium branderi TaxID=43348 RepID=A0A7I7VXK6_9MYCO|nr:hypothetical protein BST20_02670 [Mycobacterium branderi]BBZ10049.1 hypothetical protein MBRA_02440 [Mycobacterium branderi]